MAGNSKSFFSCRSLLARRRRGDHGRVVGEADPRVAALVGLPVQPAVVGRRRREVCHWRQLLISIEYHLIKYKRIARLTFRHSKMKYILSWNAYQDFILFSACPLTNTIMQLPYDVSGMEWNGCVFTHPAARAVHATLPFPFWDRRRQDTFCTCDRKSLS